jgi:drug/metabolite transporter (DMT)-like permease
MQGFRDNVGSPRGASIVHFSAFAFIALLIGGTGTGFAGIFVRLTDVSPLASAFWRMALAAPMLWIWALSVRKRDIASRLRVDYSRILLLCGAFFAGDIGVMHLALHYTSVSNATLLPNFAPVLIALWMWAMYRVRFSRIFLTGMAIALGGAILVVLPGMLHAGAGNHRMVGDGLGLLSAVFYAGYQLVIKQARDTYSAALLMAWSTTITGLVLLPFALFSGGPMLPAQTLGWLPLLGLALIAQIGGQTVISYASAHLPASLSSVSLLIQPLVATIAAWLIFSESVGPLQLIGGLMLLGGIYLSRRGS